MNWRFTTRWRVMRTALAGAALAALVTPAAALGATSSTVYGSGSSFQKVAQISVWQPLWTGGKSLLSPIPPLTYTSTASGPGLSEFGNDDGTLKTAKDTVAGPLGLLDGFVGSDDPPTPGQLALANLASGAHEITIPVAQAPFVVLLSLPSGISGIAGGTKIDLTNTVLEQAVRGALPAAGIYAANTWGALLTDAGVGFSDDGTANGGAKQITVQVRVGGSGTSFAFKNYMGQINAGGWTNFLTGDEAWPATAHISDSIGSFSGDAGNAGGSALAKHTAGIPGSLGYAQIGDAASGSNGGFTNTATLSTFNDGGGASASHYILYAQLQNNGTGGSPTYAEASSDPAHPGTAAGNCTTLAGSIAGWAHIPSAVTGSWAGTLASDPNVSADGGATFYPACAVTYDLAWDNYDATTLAGLYDNAGAGTTAQGTEATVADYLGYLTSNAGQADIQANGYNRLPDAVQTAAQAAVAAIAFTPPSGGGGGGGGGGGTPPPGGGTPPPDTSATNVSPHLKASTNAIGVTLSCPATKPTCSGTVRLKVTIKVRRGHRVTTKTIVIGGGSFSLSAGTSKKLTVKLNGKGRSTLKGLRKLRVKVTISAHDSNGGRKTTSLTLTLTAPKAKGKR